jgi:hypothetical protein
MTSEEGFAGLRELAPEHVDELMAAYVRADEMHGWLLELIGEARSPNAFDLLLAERVRPSRRRTRSTFWSASCTAPRRTVRGAAWRRWTPKSPAARLGSTNGTEEGFS